MPTVASLRRVCISGSLAALLAVAACHDTFITPDSPSLEKTPIDFGLDLTVAAEQAGLDLSVIVDEGVADLVGRDLSVHDLTHADLTKVDLRNNDVDGLTH